MNKRKSKTTSRKKSSLRDKLDRVFSKYIRLRDSMPNGYFVCISCGQIKKWEEGDAGHFYSRVHMATRWDEDNVHCECRKCNRYSSEHIIFYQVNLIRKIGENRFKKLCWKHNTIKKWEEFELQKMYDYYKAEAERLKIEKNIKTRI